MIKSFNEWLETKIGWRTDPSQWGPEARTPDEAVQFLTMFEPGHLVSSLNTGGESPWTLLAMFRQSPIASQSPEFQSILDELMTAVNDYHGQYERNNTGGMDVVAQKVAPLVDRAIAIAKSLSPVREPGMVY